MHEDKKIMINKSVCLYLLFIVLMIIVIIHKKNMHIDEVFTYGLANNTTEGRWMHPASGRIYSPAIDAWMEYVTVQDNRFDYHAVWNNQAGDVHPPLYYILIHTICSLFTGKFSLWYAGVVNIVFAVLTLWIVRRLINELTQSTEAVVAGTLYFILSAGILSGVSFFRMYIMVMFEITFVTWLFVQAIQKKRDWKFYISLIITSIAGALTHYYYIVYLFFLCVVFGLYLLIYKRYRETVAFIVSMIGAGAISILIFPSMLIHMFSKGEAGYRGQESINNLKNISFSEYFLRLKYFFTAINEELFGGFLICIIIILLAFWICRMIRGKAQNREEEHTLVLWLLVFFPSICYFLLVAKMAVLMTSRYILPIYAVVLSAFFSVLYVGISKMVNTKRRVILWLLLFISVIVINGYRVCTWKYLYSSSLDFLEKASQYQNENIIYVYDDAWKLSDAFFEAYNYKDAMFFRVDELEKIMDTPFKEEDSLFVNIVDTCDSEKILDEILEVYPLLHGYEVVGGYGSTMTYHLHS